MKKQILITAAMTAILGGGAMFAAAQNAPAGSSQAQYPAFTHPATVQQDLARLDLALNNTGTLTGDFVQYNQNGGSARGTLALQRPGKIRFEYAPPANLLIVSDGAFITQQNTKLNTADRIPLSATPLNAFLKADLQLGRDTQVTGLQKFQDRTMVTIADKKGKQAGQMTLVFNEPNLALREWIVVDEFGQTTRVELSNLRYNEELNPRLFIVRNSRVGSGGRRR